MRCRYPDLSSASDWSILLQPIRRTTQIWVVTRHQYGVSAVVPKMICVSRKTSSGVVECWLFCQVSIELGNRGKCEQRLSLMRYRQPNIAEFEVGHLFLHPPINVFFSMSIKTTSVSILQFAKQLRYKVQRGLYL